MLVKKRRILTGAKYSILLIVILRKTNSGKMNILLRRMNGWEALTMNGLQGLLQSLSRKEQEMIHGHLLKNILKRQGDIIFTLLREPEKDKEDITDYVTYTLNTPCGKLITALIYLSLRIARLNGKKGIQKEPKWDEQYKNKYDEMLEKEVIEAYTNLGRYLPNLAYLDKNWATDKVTRWLQKVAANIGKPLWTAIFPLEQSMMIFMS